MTAPENVCGVLVHCDPARFAQARDAIGALPGVEIHAEAPGGRLVVTVEDVEDSPAIDGLAAIHRVDGVVAAALVYHHFEPGEPKPADAN